mmetsp:Transcript_3018/g.7540  ORF Transcript_3018/g.7540 Transcript_3018/m.7540 type:complete len:279 (-) Transcript_3018:451-1287(-)
MVVSSEKSRQDLAMSTAVSVLSPVSTQSRMPASLIVLMASGTPSCNLSSTAVTPMNLRFFSNCAPTSAIVSSFVSSMRLRAVVYSALQASNSACSMVRIPTMRVLKPCLEKVPKSAAQASVNGSVKRPSITLSAPFVMHQMLPLCLTMTDMRLRSEEKASSCNTVKFRWEVPGPLTMMSDVLPAVLRTRLMNDIPTSSAIWTSATSSGDMPLKVNLLLPSSLSFSTACTEWQTAKQVKRFNKLLKRGSSDFPDSSISLVFTTPGPGSPSEVLRNSPMS